MAVTWPETAKDDLLVPSQGLLRGLNVLEDAPQEPNKNENSFNPFAPATTPYSLQVITAGSLAFSQQAARIVTSLGGITAVLAVIKGTWYSSSTSERVAFIGGAAVVVAALLVSLAVIVRADVQARSNAQAAEYDARARIASAFLQTAQHAQPDSAVTVQKYWLRTNDAQAWQPVDHFEKGAGGFVAVLADKNHSLVQCNAIQFLERASLIS